MNTVALALICFTLCVLPYPVATGERSAAITDLPEPSTWPMRIPKLGIAYRSWHLTRFSLKRLDQFDSAAYLVHSRTRAYGR
jgi:hypothetical protein